MGTRGRIGIATILVLVVGLALGAAGAAAKKGPKLRVSQLDPPPAKLDAGDSFRVEGEVRNNGKASSRARVRVLLSGPSEAEVGSVTTGRVGPKQTREFSLRATVPATLPSGSYRLRACVPKSGTSGKERCRTAPGSVAVTGTTVFTPGSRSLGDPLFPQIGNGGYDVSHYDIDLVYDPASNLFASATTTITATATQNLSEFSLDFQDQLQVSSVTVNGQPATFAFAGTAPLGDPTVITQLTKLVVTPAAGIPSGDEFEVVVTYSGEPQLMTDADESVEGWIPACYDAPPLTCDGAFVVNQPNGAQTWFPGNNYPTDKATFDTTITVPDSHVAFGIGELESRVSDAGETTWSWSEDDPTSTYLTTATVGLFDYARNVVFEDSTGRVLPFYGGIDSSYPAATKLNVSTTQSLTEDMLNFLGDLYGPYPLDSIGSVVDRASGVGYALEVQTKPHYATVGNTSQDISDSTQLHEIAHMWVGDTVTLERWPDIWFNEGFATWSEWVWDYEENGGGTTPAEVFDDLYANPTFDWAVAPAVLNGDPSLLFDAATYDRGAMVVQGTFEILGEDGFDELVDEIFDRYGYGNISTEEFIALAEEVSGFTGAQLDLLDDFYEQWLYGTVQPTILPEDVTGAAPRSAAAASAAAGGTAPDYPGDGR